MNQPTSELGDGVSLSAEHRLDAVCRRYEAAWQAGGQPRPDEFTAGWDGAELGVLLRELALLEREYRGRAGATPSLTNNPLLATPPAGFALPADDPLPRSFGRYTLRRQLGRGGMGRVYLAHDPHLDRLVALKMPNPVENVAGWRERFLTEARAAATLTHPNVCPVYDVGEVEGQPYLTMAFIEGETLAQRLARDGTLPPETAVGLLTTVARAMHEAHARGIIHRDLKPANLMLDTAGRPIIMDFGLAVRATESDDFRLTMTGVALGTPAYMPPEQASGEHDIGPTSDVYSLGVILFEMVTGRVPFKAKSFGKLLAQIERDAPPAPSSLNPAVDPALEALILTALAKSPTDRFASAAEFADALDTHQSGDRLGLVSNYSKPYRIPDATGEYRPESTCSFDIPPTKRRRVWWLAGTTALLAFAAALFSAIIYIETDYGQIVVQLNEPNAKVDVQINGQQVTLTPDGGKPVKVRAGKEQTLVVSGEGYETESKTYAVTRGDVVVARVTLRPKSKDGTVPPVPPIPSPEPPKPVAFPAKSTLIESDGWQILADATKDQMQAWLDEKKKAKHSVMWLDATTVAGQPVFAAVAAMDDRSPGWKAFLAHEHKEKPPSVAFRGVLDPDANRLLSISGYHLNATGYLVALWEPVTMAYLAGGQIDPFDLEKTLDANLKNGFALRVLRPYPIGTGVVKYAVVAERRPGMKAVYAVELSASRLGEFMEQRKKDGLRPISVAATPHDGELKFAVAMASDPTTVGWEVDLGLTVAKVAETAKARAATGFRPESVTAYPWDGAVRYCVIWVKEPPKPVAYPKEKTLVKQDGWETLLDATKDEMQAWLDEKKKAKHSVMWLDAYPVAEKSVFSAVAALDARQPDWVAMLDQPAAKYDEPSNELKEAAKGRRLVALSGYLAGINERSALLLHPGPSDWTARPNKGRLEMGVLDEELRRSGGGYTVFRPHAGLKGMIMFAVVAEPMTSGGARAFDLSAEGLDTFVADQHKASLRVGSICGYTAEGVLKFAAVNASNPDKWEWATDTGLTTEQFTAKATDKAKLGYHPSSVTAYPWDGAVRYCVIWVKEPPKQVAYPKAKTLIEVSGWQVLCDATKDEMQAWLDEKKRDKHSVIWLDTYPVEGKPVFSAVAALDWREPKWEAILAEPIIDFKKNSPEFLALVTTHRVIACSTYPADGQIRGALLFHGGRTAWTVFGEKNREDLNDIDALLKARGNGYVAFRPHSGFRDVTTVAMFVEPTAVGGTRGFDLSAEGLDKFVADQRKAGLRVGSICGYTTDGLLKFAAVSAAKQDKLEWTTETGLTAATLTARTAEQAKLGLHPICVTAYPWDGAVRYCVVWVKEPPPPR